MDDLLQEMIDPAPEPGDRPRRRRLVATVAIVGLAVVGVTSLTTGALFTDREQTDDGFKTGTVDLTVGQLAFDATADNMLPGDATASAVDVTNSGSLALRYAIQYTATNTPAASGDNLTDVLALAVYQVPDKATCSTSVSTSTQGVEELYAPTHLSTAVGTALIGDFATGSQPGDRTIDSGHDEWLCFVTKMDLGAGNTYQSSAAHLTLDFSAEQVANNG
jgi:spore coat-associated protein N